MFFSGKPIGLGMVFMTNLWGKISYVLRCIFLFPTKRSLNEHQQPAIISRASGPSPSSFTGISCTMDTRCSSSWQEWNQSDDQPPKGGMAVGCFASPSPQMSTVGSITSVEYIVLEMMKVTCFFISRSAEQFPATGPPS